MITVRNWHTFQHFKDRSPPWIKLHRTILDQRDINAISDCAFRVLIACWLLASEDRDMKGQIKDAEDIAFRMRVDKSKVEKALRELESFLIQDDIKTISDRYRDDVPETEEEAEAKREGETDFCSFWQAYPKKRAKDEALKAWKKKKNRPPIAQILQAIKDQKASEQWRKNGGEFIPHPATWINQGRWDDVVKVEEEPRCKKCGWEVSKCTCEDNIPL